MPTRPLVTSYRQANDLFPDRWHKFGLALAVALWVAVPVLGTSIWLTTANLALIAVVGSVALMILTGFAGQISLGHAAFLALGAYTYAILSERYGLPFFLLLPLSGAVAAIVGAIVGLAAVRIKGLYLAIVTIGLTFLVIHVLEHTPSLTHGYSGIAVLSNWWFDGPDMMEPIVFAGRKLEFDIALYGIFSVLALGAWYVAANLARSDAGRVMAAVRDHDVAASALGIHATRVKLTAFTLSSFIAGVAGAMFAMQQQFLTVNPPFNLHMSVEYVAMIVLGGVGTAFGAVAGAIVYTALTPLFVSLGGVLPVLSSLSSAQRSTVLFSIVVLTLLVWEPLGLFGVWLRIKRYFVAWPFRY